ncbi:MAG: acyl-CoA dehydrogenase, partial [Actinomycetia bacterium]|nr:acyl-CoA dehydrogenase [Actinomycetes bacterium]
DVAGQPLDEVDVADAQPLAGITGDAVLARLALLRAATIVGAVRGAYLMTRTHVRTREQFGRPLVRLPAVATALARFRVELIQAETALGAALDASDTTRASTSAAAARVVCGGAATEAARLAHQLHGALGITHEYGLHPLTRLLWATRDADLPEEHWATALGERVLTDGEPYFWDELTAVG